MAAPLRLTVLGDSLAFTDHRGPQLPGEPGLFPNVVARQLEAALARTVEVAVVARPGWGVRELWRALTKDRHLQFEVLARSDAVVLQAGSFDHLPAGVPAAAHALLPFVRPARARRALRRAATRMEAPLVTLSAGRWPQTPTAEFTRLYDAVLGQVRGLTRRAPGVVVGAVGVVAPHPGRRNPHLERRSGLVDVIAARHGYPVVDVWSSLIHPHRARFNPDGVHWPTDVHLAVGTAVADPLADEFR